MARHDPCEHCNAPISLRMTYMKDVEAVFQWIDEPPPEPPRRGRIDLVVSRLDERPSKWARIMGPYKEPSYGRNMVKTWARKFPKYEFVARPGVDGDKQFYVYARRIGRGGRRKKVG